MKLELATFTCGSCGRRFEAPVLNPYGYGEFLLRSAGGSLAFLDALRDRTFDEVDALLARVSAASSLTARRRADLLRSIYGAVACDPDADGLPHVINAPPTCPHCGAQRVSWFEHPEPAPVIDVDVPPVTHLGWNALTADDKRAAVEREVARVSAVMS